MEQQKYWECFRIKTGRWVELKLYWVRLTPQAANIVRVAVGRAVRTARIPDTISDMAAEQSDLNPIDYAVWDPTRVCVQPPPDHGRGRAAPACRGGMGPSGPGSDWQCDQWMAQLATDSLRCSRQRTFWTFTLNITAFVHILINMFWTLLTLLSFVQTDYFFLYE